MSTLQTAQTQTPIQTLKKDEDILVVSRADIFSLTPAWSGLRTVDFAHYLSLIKAKKEFLPRSLMELDPHYKQIIPYLIFTHNNRYFLMQRTAQATETRLQNKYSLGIGGHIRQEDMQTDSLFDWALREFHEEVSYAGNVTIEPLGILNDDSNEVGKVHIGFVFLLHGDSDAIAVKSELKSGTLLTIDELKPYFASMETWTQIAFEHVLAKQ
ncbi:MAG: hypothetical protein WCE21_01605 [Candidatus Babeliales bacterium]